jgi:hypothetical protein
MLKDATLQLLQLLQPGDNYVCGRGRPRSFVIESMAGLSAFHPSALHLHGSAGVPSARKAIFDLHAEKNNHLNYWFVMQKRHLYYWITSFFCAKW